MTLPALNTQNFCETFAEFIPLPTTELLTRTAALSTTLLPTTEVLTTVPLKSETSTATSTNSDVSTSSFPTTEIPTVTEDTVTTTLPYQTTEESTSAPVNMQFTTLELGDAIITSTEPNLPLATTQDSSTTEQSEVTEEESLTTHSIQDSQQGISPEGYISIAMGLVILVLIAIIVVAASVLCRLYDKGRREKGDK